MSDKELAAAKKEAEMLGLSYHPSIGLDSLKAKILAVTGTPKEVEVPKKETTPQRNARMRKEANKLVRVNLTCMNPAKASWPGEMFSVGNSAIGWIKKFVPFGAEDGWHIPQAIVTVLKERMYTQFYIQRNGGQKTKKTRLAREFAIEVMEDLTVPELKILAAKQTAEKSLD